MQIAANGCSKPKTTDTAKTVDIRSPRAAVWVNGGVVAGTLYRVPASLASTLHEAEQVRVHQIRVRGKEAVRQALVNL